jgi:23S rRNA-/tRNA-specific pseudouridylate synthase
MKVDFDWGAVMNGVTVESSYGRRHQIRLRLSALAISIWRDDLSKLAQTIYL